MKPIENIEWAESNTDPLDIAPPTTTERNNGWQRPPSAPKREVFNWWQRGVARWIEWLEDSIDTVTTVTLPPLQSSVNTLLSTVLDRWFIEVAGYANVPNVTGIYKQTVDHRFYLVKTGQMVTVGFNNPSYTADYYTWTAGAWVKATTFQRANSSSEIVSGAGYEYVTPDGLKAYATSAIADRTTQILNTATHKQWGVKTRESGDKYALVYGIFQTGSSGTSFIIDLPAVYPGGSGTVNLPVQATLQRSGGAAGAISSVYLENRAGAGGPELTVFTTASIATGTRISYEIRGVVA